MSYTPALVIAPPGIAISTVSRKSVGAVGKATDGATPISVAIGTANMAIYVPFSLEAGVTVTKLWCCNGTTANGNTDLAVYGDDYGVRIHITAAAQSGTSVPQEFDCTDTWLPPGNYYWGLLNSGTTGTYFGYANLNVCRIAGVYKEAVGAANLPDMMTPVAATLACAPIVGLVCSPRTAIP